MLRHLILVELVGFEPMTYTLRTYRSSQLSYSPICLATVPVFRQYILSKCFWWRWGDLNSRVDTV